MALPFGYPQLLGFPVGSEPRDSDINAAFDDITSSEPVQGYSSSTLHGRAQLLRSAKRFILDAKARRTSSGTPLSASITLPVDVVPAALAVLAEVGHSSMVLDLGHQLLANPESPGIHEAHDDILLSMALAYCDKARAALEVGGQGLQNQASTACLHLEEAQQLLQSAAQPPLAPALALEIQSGLRGLRAPSVQEELLGSSGAKRNAAYVERRKRAVKSLRDLLKDATPVEGSSHPLSFSAAGPVALRLGSLLRGAGITVASSSAPSVEEAGPALSQSTVRQLLASLTAEEAVHLMEWEQVAKTAATSSWLYPGLLQTVAAGHIVVGFRQRQPAYVKQAASILKQLPQTAHVLAMQGVCQLLLGSVQATVQLLKQAEAVGQQGEEQDGEVQDPDERWSWGAHRYVVQNSSAGEDGLLPGLCGWTELWLKKVAFQLFADAATTSPSASLSKYFDDTRVEALIAVYDEKSSLGTGRRVVESVVAAVQEARGVLAAAAAAPPAGGAASRLTALTAAPAGAKLVLAASFAVTLFGLAAVGSALLGRRNAPLMASGSSWVRGASQGGQLPAMQCDLLDVAAAEQLIRNWQVAKQACLGAGHDTTHLPAVLTGHALVEAQQRSSDFKDKDCHMQYQLWKCQVTDVQQSHKGLLLTALLDESASMLGEDGQTRDFYRSSYEARYQVLKCKDGAWRIAKITVVGSDGADQS